MKSMNNLQEITQKALEAFWAKIAELHPTATTGDFPPDATLTFENAAEQAVAVWIGCNVPRFPFCPKCKKFEDQQTGCCPKCGVDLTLCQECQQYGYHTLKCSKFE